MMIDKKFEKDLTKALSAIKPEMITLNFPGGKEQAKIVLQSLNYLTGGDKDLEDLLRLYLDLRVRIKLGHDFEQLYKHVVIDFARLVHEKNGGMVVAYIMLNVKDPFIKILSIEEANGLVNYARALRAKKEEQVVEDDTDYGVVLDKPIFVKGTFGAKEYLSNIRSDKGEDLRWQKTNSLVCRNINGTIDEYEGYDDEGKKHITIYISIFGEDNSKKAPKGLILVR